MVCDWRESRLNYPRSPIDFARSRRSLNLQVPAMHGRWVGRARVGVVVLVLSGSGLLYIFMSLVLPRFKAWEQQHGALSLMDVHIAVHHVFRLVWNAVFISSKKTRERREV